MDQQNMEMFAQSYPRPQTMRSQPPSPMRTPLRDIMPSGQRQEMSKEAKSGSKKFLAILLIVVVGAVLYSAFAYTMTDSLTSKMGLEFFSESGQPGAVIIAIHSLLFLVLVYFILSGVKWY